MIYTIFCGLCGMGICYVIAKTCNMNMSGYYAPGPGELLVIAGGLIGMGIGAGYGISSLMSGTHVIQKLLR